jgi:hypothetical protein
MLKLDSIVSRFRIARRFRSKSAQGGAALLLATLSMGLLLGLGGLAVDAGRLFVTKTELQSAMDSCALAASARLNPGVPNIYFLQAAEAAGKSMSDPSKISAGGTPRPPTSVNRAYFQSNDITPGSISVEFSANLTGPFATIGGGASPALSKFVRCSYDMGAIPLTMIRALAAVPGIGSTIAATTNVKSSAVASRTPGIAGNPTSSTSCGLFPISVCNMPGGTAATNWGYFVGQRITAPCSSAGPSCSKPAPGNFGWVDFTPPGGGASEMEGLMTGLGQCGSVPVGTGIIQTGLLNSVQAGWNSRFGLYGPGGSANKTNAPPDYTGFAWDPATPAPVGSSTYATSYAAKANASAIFDSSAGALTAMGYTGGAFGGGVTKITSPDHAAYGRSRRLVTAPILDCTGFSPGGSNPAPIQGFVCLFLLAPYPATGGPGTFNQKVEYLGTSDQANSPCLLSGTPGGGVGGGGVAASVPYLVR